MQVWSAITTAIHQLRFLLEINALNVALTQKSPDPSAFATIQIYSQLFNKILRIVQHVHRIIFSTLLIINAKVA